MRRLLLIGGAAAVVLASAGWGVDANAGSRSQSLLDRAYAATNVGEHQVLHEVDITGTHRTTRVRIEGWLLPADGRARVIDIDFGPFVSEWIITATGRVYGRGCLAYCHPRSFIDGRSRWENEGVWVATSFSGPWGTLPGTYARMFRASYRAHALVPDGTAEVDGKRLARFKSLGTVLGRFIAWRPGTKPPIKARNSRYGYSRLEWYVNPSTARLIGFGAWGCMADETSPCGGPKHPPLAIRIVTFQRLDPTPQNLALLTGPGAPAGAR